MIFPATILLSALATTTLAPTQATAAEDCDALYFGVGRDPDYNAAFRCYQKDAASNGFMLSLMALNGEGTPRSADQAWAYYQGAVKAHGNFKDLTDQTLEASIIAHQHLPAGAPPPHVDFCKEIAATTVDLGRCASVAARRQQLEADKALAAVKKTVGTAGDQALKDLAKGFAAFQRAAADVAGDAYRGGTIAGTVAVSETEALAKQLAATAEKVAGKVSLLTPIPTEADAKKADAELNAAYGQLMKTLDKDGQKLLKDAERRWITYRDQWVSVAGMAYKDSLAAADAKRMMITKLTQERTAALKSLLAGPEGPATPSAPAAAAPAAASPAKP